MIPGGLVFQKPDGPVPLHDATRWWAYVPGASWRCPRGPDSDLDGLDDHPVVQVSLEDAEAYAAWRGARLPTEAEWELAARGGLDESAHYTWGVDPFPDGRQMANTWQGDFPWQNLVLDGYEATSPVGAFAPNGYGLLDMAGNVWEWTDDWWQDQHRPVHACCAPGEGQRPPLDGAALGGTGRAFRPQSHQGWFPSVCSELLPPIPARRPAARSGGHRDVSHRVPGVVSAAVCRRSQR